MIAAYVVVVSARRCGDGVLLARERQTAPTKDAVLAALGRALERVRATLGESRDTLNAYDRPLQVATTDSIDALRAFELGMELRTRADNVRAIPALETAVALDPQFALAYAQLGSAYSNTGDTASATPYLRKAFELRDRATEPERLYITGRYFDIITGEMEKGAETYRLWTRMYPGEWLAFNALANDANLMGRYQIAVDAAARAVELEPRQIFGQMNLLTALVSLNRFDEAKRVAGRMLEQDPDNSSAHTARYAMADFLGDTAGRDRELAWSRTQATLPVSSTWRPSPPHSMGGSPRRRGCFRTWSAAVGRCTMMPRPRTPSASWHPTMPLPAWTARPRPPWTRRSRSRGPTRASALRRSSTAFSAVPATRKRSSTRSISIGRCRRSTSASSLRRRGWRSRSTGPFPPTR